MFGPRFAPHLASRYRKRGLDKTSARIVELVTNHGVEGATILEVGGGVGDIQIELLRRGARRATNLELVDVYDADANRLAAAAGVGDRITRRLVYIAATPDDVEPADVVILHRVVCCYPDYERLLFANRMYVSWNDFNAGDGASSSPTPVITGLHGMPRSRVIQPTFIRNVQITGDKVTGDVYIAGMDEDGWRLPSNDANKIFRSTDGGNTWTNTYTGPTFPGPASALSGFFATHVYQSALTGGTMGWGEPAAYNNVVSLVYASARHRHGDPGDVYYIRSTDSGRDLQRAIQVEHRHHHTKAAVAAQPFGQSRQAPSSPRGMTRRRESSQLPAVAVPSTPCYQMYSRKSNDNGVTWLPDDTLSDVASPLPAATDPGIQPTYAGDYDYGSAMLTKHVTSWVDGRVRHQQRLPAGRLHR